MTYELVILAYQKAKQIHDFNERRSTYNCRIYFLLPFIYQLYYSRTDITLESKKLIALIDNDLTINDLRARHISILMAFTTSYKLHRVTY